MTASGKLAGRPKLAGNKRSRKIDARFTEAEYETIVALEQQLGVSKTELVRMRLLNNGDQVLVNAKEVISKLDSIGIEMGRIGNNVNQLARHANLLNLQGNVPPYVVDQFNQLLSRYIGILQEVDTTFRRVIRTTGK
ncbi:plasmid mobilization relaxosome protein MobC [Mucilaginibacter sp. PAMB04274]|uniref:plasmid mobilization protein n=1 Tax=Mucilaginibacter sp. PAMB04274 TaxID=3138568 RepID=UPI0031F6FE6B